jgi:hypothetical protein
MAGSLKRQRLLVAAGFLLVALAFGGEILVENYHFREAFSFLHYAYVYGAAFTAGYGLLAWATWAWLRWLEISSVSVTSLAKVLKLFAISNLVFAIGMASFTYFWAHQAISFPYDGRISVAIPTLFGLQLFGFCLVSAAFWSASRVVGADGRLVSTPDESIPSEAVDLPANV